MSMLYEEQQQQQEHEGSSTALVVPSSQQQSQQVEIKTPRELVELIDMLAFRGFSYEDQAMLANNLIPGLVERVQTYTIGLGYVLWKLHKLWNEYYRKILLGAGPQDRTGFHQWCLDEHHLEVPFVNNAINTFEIWASAQRYHVQVENPAKPLSPNVQQIATTKLAKATRKIDDITDDTRLSDAEKQTRITEIEEATREEVKYLFENPEYAIVQTRKEEKGTPDKLHIKLLETRFSADQTRMVGRLEIRNQGEHSVLDILKELHKRTKDIIHWEIELYEEDGRGREQKITYHDLAALAKYQDDQTLEETVIEGIYREDDEEEDEEDEEYVYDEEEEEGLL